MGRNAAGESFLRGFISHSSSEEFWAFVHNQEHAQQFGKLVLSLGRTNPVHSIDKTNFGALTQSGVIYFPGPGIGAQAFQRAAHGHGSWSICGITHTTSSAAAMDSLAEIITSPVQTWDALICTSKAAKDNVNTLLQAQVDYLRERLGIAKIVLPQMPVIPLGIHTADFDFNAEEKYKAKKELGLFEDSLVVLFMGRLSFHAKAHPLAMYQALESASIRSGKKVVLIECGWYANEFIKNSFSEAATLACPSVQVITLDGRNHSERQTAWAASDVFCSLSDNIQETFGITPIEAMAAGLPVVVSDWDGYKDTVRDGIDGFRIPTIMPQSGLGGDFAYRHAVEIDNYDFYCGYTSMLIAVDIDAATEAFVSLFDSPALRQRMGVAGKERAKSVYDWKNIIGRYEELWANLNEIRIANSNESNLSTQPWPARMDPFQGFSSYPTQTLTPETTLKRSDGQSQSVLNSKLRYRKLKMIEFSEMILPSDVELQSVLKQADAYPRGIKAQYLIADIPDNRKPYVLRSLTWLVKMGILKVVS
jgi:glycosyltransferase involved in cell wall biosynthesis